MANTTVSKITITKDNATTLVNNIRDGLRTINKGYLAIAPDVQKLYDTHAFEVLGYKNFDDMCTDLFEMSHGTTVGIRKVFARFGSKSSKDGSYRIPEKYLEWGYTKLLLFATDDKKFKDAGIDPLEMFNPSMTIGEMKLSLSTALADKAKEQDNNAIDTDGSIIDNADNADNANDADNGDNANDADNGDNANDVDGSASMTFDDWAKDPKAYCDYILGDLADLKTILTDTIKPEKLALIDGAIAYLKDVKKAIKK